MDGELTVVGAACVQVPVASWGTGRRAVVAAGQAADRPNGTPAGNQAAQDRWGPPATLDTLLLAQKER